MLLPEYWGKRLLSQMGIAVPRGRVTACPEEAAGIARDLGGQVIVKAQVPAGGRGKAGGIRFAADPAEAEVQASELLGRRLLGHRVDQVLIEEYVEAEREFYLGILVDPSAAGFQVLLSAAGGVEVETLAQKRPEGLVQGLVDPLKGFSTEAAAILVRSLGQDARVSEQVASVLLLLYRALVENDLVMAEINPLLLAVSGDVVAADARLEADDDALYRQPELRRLRHSLLEDWERTAYEIGVSYVPMEGEIGVIASGAGLGMATLDLLGVVGLRAANFLDTGGGIKAELIRRAVELILTPPHVRGGLVNLYGGINPMVEAANGIVAGLRSLSRPKPLVVKLVGNREEEAWAVLEAERIPVVRTVRTEDAVRLLAEELQQGEPRGKTGR